MQKHQNNEAVTEESNVPLLFLTYRKLCGWSNREALRSSEPSPHDSQQETRKLVPQLHGTEFCKQSKWA